MDDSIKYEYLGEAPENVTDITIGKDVVNIPSRKFELRTKLRNVIFETDSILQTINDFAFSSCFSLNTIVLPKTVKYIGKYPVLWY